MNSNWDPTAINNELTQFLSLHPTLERDSDPKSCTAALQTICKHLKAGKSHWADSSADLSIIRQLYGNVKQLEVWISYNPQSVTDITTLPLLRASSAAFATLLPFRYVQDRYQSLHREFDDVQAAVEQMSGAEITQTLGKPNPYARGMQLLHQMMELVNSSHMRRLSEEQRDEILTDMSRDFIPWVDATQKIYFNRFKTYIAQNPEHAAESAAQYIDTCAFVDNLFQKPVVEESAEEIRMDILKNLKDQSNSMQKVLQSAVVVERATKHELVNDPMIDAEISRIKANLFDPQGLSWRHFSPQQKEILLLEAVVASNSSAVEHLLADDTNFMGLGLRHTNALSLERREQLQQLLWGNRVVPANPMRGRLTIFARALVVGNESILRLFLRYGADINAVRVHNRPALIYAVVTNNQSLLQLMLRLGADPDIGDEQGSTPLFYAAMWNRVAIAQALIDNGADINKKNANTYAPIVMATLARHANMLEMLLKAGALAQLRNDHTWKYIHSSISRNPQMMRINRLAQSTIAKEFHAAKHLSHALKFKGTVPFSGGSLKLEEAYPNAFAEQMKTSLTAFVDQYPSLLSPAEIATLGHLLAVGMTDNLEFNPSKLVSQIAQEEMDDPVSIHTGYSGHVVEVVLLNQHMLIADKGGLTRRPGELYAIDTTKMTTAEFKTLNKMTSQPNDAYVNWRNNLPQTVGATSTPFTRFLETLYPLAPQQVVANCGWESVETSVFFVLAMLRFKDFDPDNQPSSQSINELQDTFVKWLRFTQLHALDTYFEQVEAGEFPFNPALAKLGIDSMNAIKDWPKDMRQRVQALNSRYTEHVDASKPAWVKTAQKIDSLLSHPLAYMPLAMSALYAVVQALPDPSEAA